MEKEILREKLLKTGLFIENEFLDQYLDLVTDYATVNSYVEASTISHRPSFKMTDAVSFDTSTIVPADSNTLVSAVNLIFNQLPLMLA